MAAVKLNYNFELAAFCVAYDYGFDFDFDFDSERLDRKDWIIFTRDVGMVDIV